MNAALESLETLQANVLQRITLLKQRETFWDRFGDNIGYAVSALILVTLILILVATHRLVYLPIQSLERALNEYRAGARDVRLPRQSSREFQAVVLAFNSMADRLNMLERDRLRFLAGVAHDLRNPLTAMKAATTLLESGVEKAATTEVARQSLALLSRQVLRLERMVSDFLDTNRIQSGDLELRQSQHDLRTLVHDAVEMWRTVSSDHSLEFNQPEHPIWVNCDATRIEQVISNVLSNAIKYTPGGGAIEISVLQTETNAMITVKDKGIGIPQDELKRIFEPFRRTIMTRELIPGIGLGLSISLRIMNAHNGTIEVESVRGQGSTFRIILPLLKAMKQAA